MNAGLSTGSCPPASQTDLHLWVQVCKDVGDRRVSYTCSTFHAQTTSPFCTPRGCRDACRCEVRLVPKEAARAPATAVRFYMYKNMSLYTSLRKEILK